MTDDTCPNSCPLSRSSDDGDFLRVLAETTLNRLMDFDAENAIGAARHERSTERTTLPQWLPGSRPGDPRGRAGSEDPEVPLRANPTIPASFWSRAG